MAAFMRLFLELIIFISPKGKQGSSCEKKRCSFSVEWKQQTPASSTKEVVAYRFELFYPINDHLGPKIKFFLSYLHSWFSLWISRRTLTGKKSLFCWNRGIFIDQENSGNDTFVSRSNFLRALKIQAYANIPAQSWFPLNTEIVLNSLFIIMSKQSISFISV